MSSQFSTNRSAAMGSPSMTMRSRIDTRCGLVMRPVRSPWARTMLSVIRAVDVLPFVPVMWMTGYARCGSPRSLDGTSGGGQAPFGSLLPDPGDERCLDTADLVVVAAVRQFLAGSGVARRTDGDLDPVRVLRRDLVLVAVSHARWTSTVTFAPSPTATVSSS